MCQNIYISSRIELPEIERNANTPGFYLAKVNNPELIKSLKEIMNADFFYEALSHMGCSCGLCYGEWSINENHQRRIMDVQEFGNYLNLHKSNNKICVLSTAWQEFPKVYPEKIFRTTDINGEEFELEEMVLLHVE